MKTLPAILLSASLLLSGCARPLPHQAMYDHAAKVCIAGDQSACAALVPLDQALAEERAIREQADAAAGAALLGAIGGVALGAAIAGSDGHSYHHWHR
jgi:hypothetical protein